MNDKKERVYSEQDLCEYTILQKIEELERQLQSIKSEFNGLYETKEDANTAHTTISDNIASVDNNLQVHIEENVREFRDIRNVLNNFNNIIPNDIGIKDNKLGLKNGNTWLTNLNAMNLEGFTYDEVTNTLKVRGGGGSISVIELTNKNGTIASTQLSEINANPQDFAFKYNGKILLFTSADSTTYQYCNNTTSSSENNVMTTSKLLTITLSTGAYTIAEKVHNVVANSIHTANGGDLTNIQVGSKVYSIPSGVEIKSASLEINVNAKSYNVGDYVYNYISASTYGGSKIYPMNLGLLGSSLDFNIQGDCKFIPLIYNEKLFNEHLTVALVCIKAGAVSSNATIAIEADFIVQ